MRSCHTIACNYYFPDGAAIAGQPLNRYAYCQTILPPECPEMPC
ncbi:hypothetical protein [Rubidibacter lacunae]|nr:hypothetical protein [Rubidibacter lacunae]